MEIQNPKLEIRNSKQIRSSKIEFPKSIAIEPGGFMTPSIFEFRICFGFRISGFELQKTLPAGVQSAREGLLFADQIWRLRSAASQREAAYPTATTSASFVFVYDDEMTATIAPDAEQGAIVVGAFLGHFDCFFGGLDRFAIDFLDDVTGFQSGFSSR
jgi:hypothetical protein